MNTLKTAFVVLLLLAVLYGVHTVLNRPESQPPKEIAWLKPKDVDMPLVEDGTTEDTAASSSSRDGDPVSSPPKRKWSSAAKEKSADESASRAAHARDRETAESPPSPAPSKISTFVPPPDLAPAENSKRYARDVAAATPPSSRSFRETSPAAPEKSPYDGTKTSVEQKVPGDSDDAGSPPADPPPPSSPAPNSSTNGSYRNPLVIGGEKDDHGAPKIQTNPYARDTKSRSAGNSADKSSSGSSSAYATGNQSGRNIALERAWQTAKTQIADEKWREALLTLSYAYEDPKVTAAERNKLLDLLDPLAAKVIYSTEHLAEAPHTIRRGETLFTIADQYRVPWQLLQNINDVRNPEVLVPGTKIKVVRGPFHADVNLAANEMTLYCQRLYAGRFPIEAGADPAPTPGAYDVRAKQPGHAFYSADGKSLAPDDPRNPFGRCWIDLGHELAIHGSPATADPRGPTGCISLSPKDADDVLGILSQGSKVTIRR